MEGDVKKVGTIDCTPTWESLVDVIIDGIITNKNQNIRNEFRHELIRMARLADAYVEIIKKQELK